MLNKKSLKPLVGGTIWVIPTSNSVSRTIPLIEQIEEMKLLKVGTTQMEISCLEFNNGSKYPIDGGMNIHNYGYIPFATEQDAKNHLLSDALQSELKHMNWKHLSYEDTLAIEAILKK